jgi:broad specificity phosphatase PhoE
MNYIDYKTKYIKYKTKYLDLIKQYGGTDPFTVVCCSHQGRLMCLIRTLTDVVLDKKFKNCCILKLKIRKEYSILDLVYSGEVFGDNPVTREGPNEDLYYSASTLFSIPAGKINYNTKDIDIYFIRHADGKHLELKRAGTIKKLFQAASEIFTSDEKILRDAALTCDGEAQSLRAGKALNELIKNVDFLFCSDLQRTRQTLKYMLKEVDIAKIKTNNIMVLPCSHEIANKKKGECDIGQGFWEKKAPENKPLYENMIDVPKPMNMTISGEIFTIDWAKYFSFYVDKMRQNSVAHNKCTNKTMLEVILEIVAPVLNHPWRAL